MIVQVSTFLIPLETVEDIKRVKIISISKNAKSYGTLNHKVKLSISYLKAYSPISKTS
jgi:hypothetical protein